jgi:hypothetical protein
MACLMDKSLVSSLVDNLAASSGILKAIEKAQMMVYEMESKSVE